MTEEISNVKSYYKGQNIFKEGQPGSTAFMIRKGSVNIYRTNNNRKITVARLGKGEIFGEMGALAGAHRSTGAEAAEFCELMVLTRQFMKNLLEKSPKTIQHLMRNMVRSLQQSDCQNTGKEHRNTFLSVCKLLEMACENHFLMPARESKKDPNHSLGISRSSFSRTVKGVLLVSQLEIDRILEQLASLKVIEMTNRKTDRAFTEKFIKLCDPKTFFQVSSNLRKELKDPGMDNCTLEYIDLFDFADEVGSTPDIIYKKIAQSEIPETLFFLNQEQALNWAQSKGKDFFKTVKRIKKKIQDIEDVNDLIFVDNATIKEALSKLGYYKTGILLSVAEEESRKKILGNLAKKIANVIQEEAAEREFVDESEALDIQDELIGLIKSIKGVAV